MMTLYLCGFMGCGKSTAGKLLAEKLNRPFVDLDTYIEDKQNMKISEIFGKYGEPHFRNLERVALSDFSYCPTVIATGGGALVSKENSDIARQNGVIIFIDTSFDNCYVRIANDVSRPIALNKSKDELFELFQSRRVCYIKNSDFKVDGNKSPEEIAETIIALINS